jgi:hypothetical protein
MEEQKVMYNDIVDKNLKEIKGSSFTLCFDYREWKQLQKKIEKEFGNEYWDYEEVRISGWQEEQDKVEIEGHSCLERRRHLGRTKYFKDGRREKIIVVNDVLVIVSIPKGVKPSSIPNVINSKWRDSNKVRINKARRRKTSSRRIKR